MKSLKDIPWEKYNKILKAAVAKPIAIGECTTLPIAKELSQQPRWTFFMPLGGTGSQTQYH